MVPRFSNIVHLRVYQILTKHVTCFSPDKKGAFGAMQFSHQFLAENPPEDTTSSVFIRAKYLNMNWLQMALAFSGCLSRLEINSH